MTKKEPTFRIHLSTTIILMFTASTLLAFNFGNHAEGWPFDDNIVTNLIIGLDILMIAYAFSEAFIRHRYAPKNEPSKNLEQLKPVAGSTASNQFETSYRIFDPKDSPVIHILLLIMIVLCVPCIAYILDQRFSTSLLTHLATLNLSAILLYFLAVIAYSHWLVKLNMQGAALLEAGNVPAASACFETFCRYGRLLPKLHAIAVFNRGLAYLREGQIDRALLLFHSVLKSMQFENKGNRSLHYLYSGLASAYSLKGELDDAEKYQALMHSAKGGDDRQRLYVNALVANRHGRFADAAREILKENASVRDLQSRHLCMLGAFACAHSGDPILQNDMEKLLAGAKPFQPGEYDYLTHNWPEFRSFLILHGFLTSDE